MAHRRMVRREAFTFDVFDPGISRDVPVYRGNITASSGGQARRKARYLGFAYPGEYIEVY